VLAAEPRIVVRLYDDDLAARVLSGMVRDERIAQ